MIVGILPNVNSINLNRDVNSVISARLHTGRLKVRSTQQKNEKRMVTSAVAILKDARQLGCVFQDTEPPESLPILRKSTKVLGSIRISVVRTPKNLRIGLRRRLKDRRDVLAETRGDWPRISQSSEKRTKLPFSHPPTNGVSQRHP